MTVSSRQERSDRGTCFWLFAFLMLLAQTLSAQRAPDTVHTTRSGIYTAAQAERGRMQYAMS